MNTFKYKIGDKVKIKTWEKMKNEFGVTDHDNWKSIDCEASFTDTMEHSITNLTNNRIVTIAQQKKNTELNTKTQYIIKENGCGYIFSEDMIEGIAQLEQSDIIHHLSEEKKILEEKYKGILHERNVQVGTLSNEIDALEDEIKSKNKEIEKYKNRVKEKNNLLKKLRKTIVKQEKTIEELDIITYRSEILDL